MDTGDKKGQERHGRRGQKRQHGSSVTVTTESGRKAYNPLTPEGGKPRIKPWNGTYETDCCSPTILETRPSLSSADVTQVVPQVSVDELLEEQVVLAGCPPTKSLALNLCYTVAQEDDSPQTPREQMIKALTEPPPVKPVIPLQRGDYQEQEECSAETTSRNTSPSILSSSLCGWL